MSLVNAELFLSTVYLETRFTFLLTVHLENRFTWADFARAAGAGAGAGAAAGRAPRRRNASHRGHAAGATARQLRIWKAGSQLKIWQSTEDRRSTEDIARSTLS